jgi:hypothetical protein
MGPDSGGMWPDSGGMGGHGGHSPELGNPGGDTKPVSDPKSIQEGKTDLFKIQIHDAKVTEEHQVSGKETQGK